MLLQNCIGQDPQMGLEKLKNFSICVNERPWKLGHNSPVLRLHSKWIPINPSFSHRWQYFSPVTASPDLCQTWELHFQQIWILSVLSMWGVEERAPIKPCSRRNTPINPVNHWLENRLWFSWSNIECSDFAMTELAMQAYIGITFHFKI